MADPAAIATLRQTVAQEAAACRLAKHRRDQAIRAMRAAGATQKAVADAAGMTSPGIRRIVDAAPPTDNLPPIPEGDPDHGDPSPVPAPSDRP